MKPRLETLAVVYKFNSLSCVCPVIGDEFRYNIVKVALDPRRGSQVDPQTSLTITLNLNLLSITGQTYEKLTLICYFYDNKLSALTC